MNVVTGMDLARLQTRCRRLNVLKGQSLTMCGERPR
jgi:hypothetical protein